ncbi:uncharacterized protein P884DRAFT_119621 [Thermothelomyces heterothallicus CBS 202.75]|uniref:uncharacterized protein n=1 Tax=Thermothelomyces heterothallicus CBS 202.75 TaxID=1149848 RepID=UPI003742BD5D
MASLNLSTNGPSIKSSYSSVINGPALSSTSPTAARWALFTVQAPLVSAFQNTGAKESVLKVESTGDGELANLVEEFSEGRIQFAFVRVKDPNSGLPKNVLIAWCGGGVPERTKGYFTSHTAAVSKVLHGYHVQITARSEADLVPEDIVQKVADASGAKYSSGTSTPAPSAPPPVSKKPVFTPTTSGSGSSYNPLVAARTQRPVNTDDDGWGADAPPVTRTELEKVEPAYKPTKVDIASLRKNKDDSRFDTPSRQDDRPSDIVKGGYQPVGKVDIAALRAQAKQDDKPTVVKGAYEPVGKVDIAALRARSQRPAEEEESAPAPKSLAERSAAFTSSERLTELPKPKVAKKFGATPFTGTKAPTPVGLGFGAPSAPPPPPVGSASRTFADQGGKTPAQIWAEKKGKQAGVAVGSPSPPVTTPIAAQKSGSEWKSGYTGKSWAPVQTTNFGRGGVEKQKTGETERSEPEVQQPVTTGSGGVSALRDKFRDAAPMGTPTRSVPDAAAGSENEPALPPPPMESRPAGGFALPGLPSRPAARNQEEEEEAEVAPSIPSRNYEEREPSPVRVAMPVPRSAAPEIESAAESLPSRPIPVPPEVPKEEELPADFETHNPRTAAAAVAGVTVAAAAGAAIAHAADDTAPTKADVTSGGKRALVQYDYEKAEDNEIELREGEYVTNIEMVHDDWWMGTNSRGESGLFPSNYVEIVDEEEGAPAAQPAAPAPAAQQEEPPAATSGPTATAQFDYEAAEDNELSFPEGALITDLDFPSEDWWFGHYNGASGLFPANYVQLNS